MKVVGTIVGHEIVVEERPLHEVSNDPNTLFPSERATICSAVAKRQHEFIAGRVLARAALDRLGLAACPIVSGHDRAPIWPASVVGSISHSTTWCAVALTRERTIRSIGIDVEEASPLEKTLHPMLLGEVELLAIKTLPRGQQELAAKILFSVKESFFKAQYSLTKRMLDYHAIRANLDWTRNRWSAKFNDSYSDTILLDRVFEGCWIIKNGLIATSLIIRGD